jgi:hypothetical protein
MVAKIQWTTALHFLDFFASVVFALLCLFVCTPDDKNSSE